MCVCLYLPDEGVLLDAPDSWSLHIIPVVVEDEIEAARLCGEHLGKLIDFNTDITELTCEDRYEVRSFTLQYTSMLC